ncbi:MAG: hypothetical protein LBH19_02250 [Dysgonamonadaceae bacterium]|jgi:hypothetical protein|nr:hypothetical protein [Dysgonamonadaceae bacterium]
MKKAIFLSFLLLADIALLAHAVIPHHHHHWEPAAMCTDRHEHQDAAHRDGDTKENNRFEDCLVSHIYAKVDNNKQTFRSFEVQLQPVVCLLFLCPDCAITQIIALAGLPFRLKPYIPFLPAEFIVRSIGLRAPPVC